MKNDNEIFKEAIASVNDLLGQELFKVAKPKQKPFFYRVWGWVDENNDNHVEEFDNKREANKRTKELLTRKVNPSNYVEIKKFKTSDNDLVQEWEYRLINGKVSLVDTW